MPSQAVMAVPASQLSVAVPRSVSFAVSSAEQSATRPGLAAGLGTAVPFSQRGVGVCAAAWDVWLITAARLTASSSGSMSRTGCRRTGHVRPIPSRRGTCRRPHMVATSGSMRSAETLRIPPEPTTILNASRNPSVPPPGRSASRGARLQGARPSASAPQRNDTQRASPLRCAISTRGSTTTAPRDACLGGAVACRRRPAAPRNAPHVADGT